MGNSWAVEDAGPHKYLFSSPAEISFSDILRTIAYYEAGQRTIPPHVLCALADFYGTSIDYLLGRTDESKPYPKGK